MKSKNKLTEHPLTKTASESFVYRLLLYFLLRGIDYDVVWGTPRYNMTLWHIEI